MKTTGVLASVLACAGNAVAAPVQDTYYNLVTSAYGQSIDGASLKANGGLWYIGKEANSTCSDVSPAVTVTSSGTLSFHADGRQNQQYSYVDISGTGDGLLGFTLPNQFTSPSQVSNNFTLVGSEQDNIRLFFSDDGNWLACPQDGAGQYSIYAKKMYGKPVGKDKCLPFEIHAEQVEAPATVCVYN